MIEKVILQDTKVSPSFSVMTDESTDVAMNKQLVMLRRVLVDGKNQTQFVVKTLVETFSITFFFVNFDSLIFVQLYFKMIICLK